MPNASQHFNAQRKSYKETFARRLAYILFVNSLYNRELFRIFEY